MGRHKTINGIQIPLTAEEETARDAEETAAAAYKAANAYKTARRSNRCYRKVKKTWRIEG